MALDERIAWYAGSFGSGVVWNATTADHKSAHYLHSSLAIFHIQLTIGRPPLAAFSPVSLKKRARSAGLRG